MGTTRFTLRTDKLDKKGTAPIELIYQVQGQRKKHRLKDRVFPPSWDQDRQRVLYLDKKTAKKFLPAIPFEKMLTEREVKVINNSLDKIEADINDIEWAYEKNKQDYTPSMVIDRIKAENAPRAKRDESSNLVFDYIDKYITENKAIREPGSLSVYKALKQHLGAFQRVKQAQISFTTIDTAFFRSFQAFLVTPRKEIRNGKQQTVQLNNTTAAKQLSTLKTFLNYAKQDGVKVSDKYRDFKISKPKLEVIALTTNEFETLYNLDLSNNRRLDQVRDIFCFACATGFRFSDIAQLRREHIKPGEIRINVKKTKVELEVPLNPYSATILRKYAENQLPLPRISNQKFNKYVKELAAKAGINEPVEIVRSFGNKRVQTVYPKYELISAHTGRKTFVTLSLAKGMSAEEVMEISGHENYASFRRYVNITKQRKKESMQKGWGSPELVKIKSPKLKAV